MMLNSCGINQPLTSKQTPQPFNSQIKFVILLTVNHTVLIMLVQRI